jgi:predicted ATPase/DNA-binding SARP family transcriptional activator
MYLFGRFRIERESKSIQLSTRKTEALLAYLVLNSGKHAREKIAALFWGDSSDTEARNSLRNALAVINKKLDRDLLLADRQHVERNPDYPLWVDVLEFEKQVSGYLEDSAFDIEQVSLELYQDDLLTDFYEDWIFPLREHYHSLFLDTLLQMTQQMRSRSEYDRAVDFASKALAFDPANERAHQHLMFCYMSQGDRSAALRQFEACQQALWEELAVKPATATEALYEWIKKAPAEAKPFEAQITNLPIPLTSFIGRVRETAEVKELLVSTRLLTLTGSGGSGKTRLAIQVATDLLDAFRDGVWWVEFGALTDEALIPQAIAKTLGAQESANQPIHETLAQFLRSKELLLVMDNCEHLIDACAQTSESMLGDCPHLKILTTSREALNIHGETVWQVSTLSSPDPEHLLFVDRLMDYESIHLFVERAMAARPDFALTEDNASFVVQICHRLDGIPLAIELAAARVKIMMPEQIAARLNDRFRLLTGGSRTTLPRHQTLRAAIDWSYDLLTEQEQTLFRRLGVFSGGWTLEAAEAVCSDGIGAHAVLDLLTSLVDKSMAIGESGHDGESRFRMLETIREYSRKKLIESGKESEIRTRHLDYYLGLIEIANPHLGFFLPDKEMGAWLEILGSELDNLRTALKFSQTELTYLEAGLRLAGNLHWFWLARGQLSEGRDWLDRILARSSSASTSVLALAWLSAGFLGCWQGDFAAARTSLEKSLVLYEEVNEKPGIAFSLHGLGFAANGLGEHALASPLFARGLEIAREIDDKWLISFTLHFIAIGTSFQGKHELARAQFKECIQLVKDGNGNAQGIAFSLFHLGRIARLQGDYALANTNHAESVQMFWQMGDRRGIGYSLAGFACLAFAEEDIERAARLFGAVDSLREELGALLEVILENEYERAKTATKEILGEDEFNTIWSSGYGWSVEHAIQYALGEINSKGN